MQYRFAVNFGTLSRYKIFKVASSAAGASISMKEIKKSNIEKWLRVNPPPSIF